MQWRLDVGQEYWFIPGPMKFCVSCGVEYPSFGKDSNRLVGLSGEGRSSATTMITLNLLNQLFHKETEGTEFASSRKLLGFSDNRQDAALQSGHFNDFIFLITLRSALLAALMNNKGVLTEEYLAEEVFTALGFDSHDPDVLQEYLLNPELLGNPLQKAQSNLRYVLGYRLFRDVRRGWRFNNPNLFQLQLIDITYQGLHEFCYNNDYFSRAHRLLRDIDGKSREALYTLLFNEMRGHLCIATQYLDHSTKEKVNI